MTDVITTEEAASILGLRPATMLVYRGRGAIELEPVAQAGNSLLWSRGDVERLARLRGATA